MIRSNRHYIKLSRPIRAFHNFFTFHSVETLDGILFTELPVGNGIKEFFESFMAGVGLFPVFNINGHPPASSLDCQ